MRPVVITRALTAAVATAIAAAQQTGAAGNLVINGTLAVAGVATLDAQRLVGIASAGNLSAVTFTVFGTDQAGQIIQEALAGPNNNTVSTTTNFYTITRVAVSAAVGTNVTVGTTGVGASLPIPLDVYLNPMNVTLKLGFSGAAANATVQYTNDPIFSTNPANIQWTDDTDLQALSAGFTTATLISAVTAVRILTNSGTGTVTLAVTQSGLMS